MGCALLLIVVVLLGQAAKLVHPDGDSWVYTLAFGLLMLWSLGAVGDLLGGKRW